MFNIPFFISYSVYSDYVLTTFTSLQLTDDIKFLSYIILNLAYLHFIIVLLKFLKGLIYFIVKWCK